MRAVSNTSPLSNLATIGRLSLLKSQFSEIWITPAVLRELQAHPDPVAFAAIQDAIRETWIKPVAAPVSPLLKLLLLSLHIGEAETIALVPNPNRKASRPGGPDRGRTDLWLKVSAISDASLEGVTRAFTDRLRR
jgi:predicted nucleic acid-binding protein